MAPRKTKPSTGEVVAQTPTPAVAQPKALLPYDWAANTVKLNRSIAWVNVNKKGLKGEELEAAVRARYEELGGLIGEGGKPSKKGKKGNAGETVNLAENNVGDEDED